METALNMWKLPGELLDAILALLEPRDLARVAQVCKALRERALADHWWIRFIQRNLPSVCGPVSATPLPAHVRSFHELYVAHEARWFLPRHKIWISGPDMVGKVVLVRYDPRRACIEGYQLVAISRRAQTFDWPTNPSVVVQAFEPEVRIHLDRPILKLDAHLPEVAPLSTSILPQRPAQEDKGKGKEKATGFPQGPIDSADAEEQPPQKKPKISFYQPPGTSFSWDAYAYAISSDTPAIGPICPRIRPVMMDLDGGSPYVPNPSRIRRQFIFGRPLHRDVAVVGGVDSVHPRNYNRSADPGMFGPIIGTPGYDDVDGHVDDFADWRRPYRSRRSTIPYPQYTIWPPPELPAPHRVRSTEITPHHYPRGPVGQPRLRSDVSERAFHIRTWLEASAVDIPRMFAAVMASPPPLSDATIAAADTPEAAASNAVTEAVITTIAPYGSSLLRANGTFTTTEADVASSVAAAAAATEEAEASSSSAGASTEVSSSAATTSAQPVPPEDTAPSAPVSTTDITSIAMPLNKMVRDTLETYATIDPHYYTPTEDRPFRGLFVGDYSAHGCEFLLVYQSDDVLKMPTNENAEGGGYGGGGESDEDTSSSSSGSASAVAPVDDLPRFTGESDGDYAQRLRDHRIYRGSIRAIKLTGDPNVPRGEVSFLAPDLGPNGLDRVIHEEPFANVRMVKSRGHIAGTRFINDRWIETRLLLISPDRLAMFWVGFGHISFFERLDIDQFLDPLSL
ncbi:hypothetical protein SEUCBS139899_008952 [Sporothrix eucalyptigena]